MPGDCSELDALWSPVRERRERGRGGKGREEQGKYVG